MTRTRSTAHLVATVREGVARLRDLRRGRTWLTGPAREIEIDRWEALVWACREALASD